MSFVLPPITARAQTMRGVYDKKLPKAFAKPTPPPGQQQQQQQVSPANYLLPWHIQMNGALRDGAQTLRMGTQGWKLGASSMRPPAPPPQRPPAQPRTGRSAPRKKRKHYKHGQGRAPKHALGSHARRTAFEATVGAELNELDQLRMQIAQLPLDEGGAAADLGSPGYTNWHQLQHQHQHQQPPPHTNPLSDTSGSQHPESARRPRPWNPGADLRLAEGYGLYGGDWRSIAEYVGPHWTATECLHRWQEIKQGSCLNGIRKAIQSRNPRALQHALQAAKDMGIGGEDIYEAEDELERLKVWVQQQAERQALVRAAKRRQADLHIQELLQVAKQKLRAISYSVHGQDPRSLFDLYDTNNDGTLSFHEFQNAVRKGGNLTRHILPDKDLVKIYRAVDIDGNSSVSIDELTEFIWDEGEEAAEEQAVCSAEESEPEISCDELVVIAPTAPPATPEATAEHLSDNIDAFLDADTGHGASEFERTCSAYEKAEAAAASSEPEMEQVEMEQEPDETEEVLAIEEPKAPAAFTFDERAAEARVARELAQDQLDQLETKQNVAAERALAEEEAEAARVAAEVAKSTAAQQSESAAKAEMRQYVGAQAAHMPDELEQAMKKLHSKEASNALRLTSVLVEDEESSAPVEAIVDGHVSINMSGVSTGLWWLLVELSLQGHAAALVERGLKTESEVATVPIADLQAAGIKTGFALKLQRTAKAADAALSEAAQGAATHTEFETEAQSDKQTLAPSDQNVALAEHHRLLAENDVRHQAEMAAMKVGLQEKMEKYFEEAMLLFQELDADGNGSLDRSELQSLTEKLAAAGGGDHRPLSSMELDVAMDALGVDGADGTEIDFTSFWRWWGQSDGGSDDALRHQLRAAKMTWVAQAQRVKMVVQFFASWRNHYRFKLRSRQILLSQYMRSLHKQQARTFVAWATYAAQKQQLRAVAADEGRACQRDLTDLDAADPGAGDGGRAWADVAHAIDEPEPE